MNPKKTSLTLIASLLLVHFNPQASESSCTDLNNNSVSYFQECLKKDNQAAHQVFESYKLTPPVPATPQVQIQINTNKPKEVPIWMRPAQGATTTKPQPTISAPQYQQPTVPTPQYQQPSPPPAPSDEGEETFYR